MSDRLFAGLAALVALAYIVGATGIQASFLSDPVGPKTFPYLIGGAALLACLVIIARPTAAPTWPNGITLLKLLSALVMLVAYTYALKPLGFVLPTAIAAGYLSYLIGGHPGRSALTGVGLAVGLFLVFRYLLGLGLVGWPGIF